MLSSLDGISGIKPSIKTNRFVRNIETTDYKKYQFMASKYHFYKNASAHPIKHILFSMFTTARDDGNVHRAECVHML